MSTNDQTWQVGTITDEQAAALRAQVGIPRELSPWNSRASYDAIWHYALGIGDDNPLWWDPSYAEHTRWGTMFAPPTFLYSCSRGGPVNGKPPGGLDEFEALQGVMGLWSSDRWVWRSRLGIDERVRATTELNEVKELETRFSGRTLAHVDKVTYYGEDDRVIAELYHTVLRVERSAARDRGRYLSIPSARYSEAEVQEMHEQYEREPEQRTGAATKYWDDVQVGENLITLLKGPLTMTNLVGWQQGWGSLLCQTNRMAYRVLQDFPGARLVNTETGIEDTLAGGHWDPHFTSRGGMARAYDFGGQRISWLAHLMTDWCGDDGMVTELDVRLRRPNFLGDVTWMTGQVVGKEIDCIAEDLRDSHCSVRCEIKATNQRGEITASGSATVALPKRTH